MPDIPPELWIAILDKLRCSPHYWTNAFPDPFDIPTLKALTLASHLLHSIAEPFLYERFRLEGRSDRLLAKIDQRTSHPLWVKYLMIANCRGNAARHIFSICPQLRSLRGVSLHDVTIEAQAIHQILHLPFLEMWESSEMQLKGELQVPLVAPEKLSLKHARLGVTPNAKKEAEFLARLVVSDQLESLEIMPDTSTALRILQAGENPFAFHQLRSFQGAMLPAFDLLYDSLRRCPNVTSVHITGEVPSSTTLSPAHPDILPRLRNFKGSPRAARLFIQRRPVDHIVLC